MSSVAIWIKKPYIFSMVKNPIYPNFLRCGGKAPLLYFYLWVCAKKLKFPHNPEYLLDLL